MAEDRLTGAARPDDKPGTTPGAPSGARSGTPSRGESEGASGGVPAAPPGDRLDRRTIVLGLVVVCGTVMAILDTTIVNVALRTLGEDFHAGLGTIQWVVTGYLLALAMVIPLTGWAIDRFGARRVWMTSIVLFVLGSALAGLSWNIGSLITFRVLQGLGGGMLMPTGMAILTLAAGPRRMGRVMSIVGVPMLLGPVFGPVVGGYLVQRADWRWIFFVNLPVGIVALLLAWWKVPRGRPREDGATLDVRGMLLLSPGFVLLIYGLSTASGNGGFGNPDTLAWLIAGALLVAAFVVHGARRGDRALIDVRLYRNRTYATASAVAFLVGTVLLGSMLLIPLYYQLGRGQGALDAGLLMAPQGIGAAVSMPLAGVLTDRLGAGRVVPFGIIVLTLGTIPFTQLHAETSYWLLGSAMFVRGLGIGATMMPSMSAAVATLERTAVPRATSALNIVVQLGGSFGTALLAVVLSQQLTANIPAAARGASGGNTLGGGIPEALRPLLAPHLATAFSTTFWVALVLGAALIVPALLLPHRGRRTQDDAAPAPPAA
ncbi:DHA2 family efflux MFS transporter permease subunit [Actinomadura harenae]|uniref:DHA2 family efflux MFS transporter permease subunit n=1 Tax=Actinomadura harenae TaxID=2483351 RepID=A0A3M2LFP3_9ACTN|nr:DHA2 family efflux MFS transporter permease subunit [Actinomadura harenae]RMI36282.1 DHA2 family efflux MFS transporter permease subunit [Actinomadura harenae]